MPTTTTAQKTMFGDDVDVAPSTQAAGDSGGVHPAVVDSLASAIEKQEGYYPGSRSYRNNNPGNLKFAGQPGAVKGEEGFAQFDSPDSGRREMRAQIERNIGRGMDVTGRPVTNIGELAHSWASGPTDDPAAYAKGLSASTGYDSAAPFTSLMPDSTMKPGPGRGVSGTTISATGKTTMFGDPVESAPGGSPSAPATTHTNSQGNIPASKTTAFGDPLESAPGAGAKSAEVHQPTDLDRFVTGATGDIMAPDAHDDPLQRVVRGTGSSLGRTTQAWSDMFTGRANPNTLAEMVPLVGPAAVDAGRMLATPGQRMQGAGAATALLAPAVIPNAPPMPELNAGKIAAVAQGAGRGMIQGAMEGVPVTHGMWSRLFGGGEFKAPASIAHGLQGAAVGRYMGGTPGEYIGGAAGAITPIVRGAIRGGREAATAFGKPATPAIPPVQEGVPVTAPLPSSFVPGVGVKPPLGQFASTPASRAIAVPPPSEQVSGLPLRPPLGQFASTPETRATAIPAKYVTDKVAPVRPPLAEIPQKYGDIAGVPIRPSVSGQPARSPLIPVIESPSPVRLPGVAPVTQMASAQAKFLDDISIGQAGKKFVNLKPEQQNGVRAIAAKMAEPSLPATPIPNIPQRIQTPEMTAANRSARGLEPNDLSALELSIRNAQAIRAANQAKIQGQNPAVAPSAIPSRVVASRGGNKPKLRQ